MSESERGAGRLDSRAFGKILEITRELARPIDLATMLSAVIDAGRDVLRAERGTVFLYEQENDELVVSVATGNFSVRVPADRGIVGECVRTRQIVNVPDCYADPRFDPEIDRKTGFRTRCLLSVPLVGYDDTLVGVLQLLNKTGGSFDGQDEEIASALAAQCAVALQRVRMFEQLIVKERFERELAVAREIQIGFLPRRMPAVAGYDIAGLSQPADETGGDTFDLVPLDDGRVVLLLGDATGHGVGPALSATQVRAMLRMALRLGADLDTTFVHINNQLEHDLASNRFVTAFLGQLDPAAHVVTYQSGGQGPLLHFHAAERRCEWLKPTTFPLGLLPQGKLDPARRLELAPGDILWLMTDGVFEYQDETDAFFGTERVEALLHQHHGGAMTDLIQIVLAALRDFGGSAVQGDDITLVLVRRIP